MHISAEGITTAKLLGLANEDVDLALIRNGIERLAEAMEDHDPSKRGRGDNIGMLAGPGATEHLRGALDALDARYAGWAMQHLDSAYQTYVHPAAMVRWPRRRQ
ncbi:hypothetical protein ACUY3B_08465 [Corynebacterium ureicelerivorans]